ncbi:hypothetical protein [Absidia glauca]|uniref:Ndc10 domain-containing protein n=1 Tax=Absidia glauca TaxID=4829 RepID=A0A163JE78_ABSGL|nr:hypothetical protein [Absidia glauca]
MNLPSLLCLTQFAISLSVYFSSVPQLILGLWQRHKHSMIDDFCHAAGITNVDAQVRNHPNLNSPTTLEPMYAQCLLDMENTLQAHGKSLPPPSTVPNLYFDQPAVIRDQLLLLDQARSNYQAQFPFNTDQQHASTI